jgi:UDP-2,3-diacylglucosamine pyrophosphatase LpxH
MLWRFDAIVVCDLHLGARISRTEDFLRFLDEIETERLVVAGDVFDDPWLRGLERRHVRVLEVLRDLGRFGCVEWLCGNHDPSADWFAGVLGIEPADETVLDVDERRYLVCHGHVRDTALELPPAILKSADAIYRTCQWLDPSHRLARQLKRRSKRFTNSIEKLRHWAIAEARRRSFEGVILGHTHAAEETRMDGVHYLNSGCWTERPSGFVGVRYGEVRQYFWDQCVVSVTDRRGATTPLVRAPIAA